MVVGPGDASAPPAENGSSDGAQPTVRALRHRCAQDDVEQKVLRGPASVPSLALNEHKSRETATAAAGGNDENACDRNLPFPATRLRSYVKSTDIANGGRFRYKMFDAIDDTARRKASDEREVAEVYQEIQRLQAKLRRLHAQAGEQEVWEEVPDTKAEIVRLQKGNQHTSDKAGFEGTYHRRADSGDEASPAHRQVDMEEGVTAGTGFTGGGTGGMKSGATMSKKKSIGNKLLIGRGEALYLRNELERICPNGMLTDMLRKCVAASDSSSALDALDSAVVHGAIEALDATMGEAAAIIEPVSKERAHLVRNIRSRYLELVSVAMAVVDRLKHSLQAERSRTAQQQRELRTESVRANVAEEELEKTTVDKEALAKSMKSLRAEISEQQESLQDVILRLETENQMLEGEVQHFEIKLREADGERERAVTTLLNSYAAELEVAQNERSDLEQQIRYLRRQAVRTSRESLVVRGPPLMHTAVQTEFVRVFDLEEAMPLMMEIAEAESPSLRSPRRTSWSEGDTNITAYSTLMSKMNFSAEQLALVSDSARGLGALNLGTFNSLICLKRQGTVRPLGFVLRCLGQFYSDWFVHHAHSRDKLSAAGEGNQQQIFGENECLEECFYDWVLSLHGVRHLADMHVVDIIASVRHYQGQSKKLLHFSRLSGMFEDNSRWRSMEMFKLYVMCIHVLSQDGIVGYFTSAMDGKYTLSPLDILGSLPDIFTNYDHPDEMGTFMREKAEPLMSGSSTVDGDELIDVLLHEFIIKKMRIRGRIESLVRADKEEETQTIATFGEFRHLISGIASDISHERITQLYRRALQLSNADTISPAAFADAIISSGLPVYDELAMHPAKITMSSVAPEGRDNPHDVMESNRGEILRGILRARSETVDDEFKSLVERSHPDDGAMIQNIAEVLSHFNKLLSSADNVEHVWEAYRKVVESLVLSARSFNSWRDDRGPTSVAARLLERTNRNSSLTGMLQESKMNRRSSRTQSIAGGYISRSSSIVGNSVSALSSLLH